MTGGAGERPTLPPWLRESAAGVSLRVRVKPGAKRPGIEPSAGEALVVRVRARPVDGAANEDVLHLMAQVLGVAPTAMRIARGARGRDKLLIVQGATVHGVLESLAAAGVS